MDRLLMIADDLTGALDAGVCFAQAGINTCVCQESAFAGNRPLPECSVLVCVAETRHVSPEEAYLRVHRVASRGVELGFRYLFKKTDSALRGNVGAELAALKSAAQAKRLYFVPAFPKMNRATRQGVQYIDGTIPVSQSVFGSDPFNPVRHSAVLEILKETTDSGAYLAEAEAELPEGIAVFDAQTEQDVLDTARRILSRPDTRVLAGCAGLSGVLPGLLDLERSNGTESIPKGNLLVFCGSINPISLAQCRRAGEEGAPFFHLIGERGRATPDVLAEEISQSARLRPITLFDTGSADTSADLSGRSIARQVGQVIRKTLELAPQAVPMIIGGDTLLEFLRQQEIETIYPLEELSPGVVLAYYFYQGRRRCLISKSGGFGDQDLLLRLQRKLSPPIGEESAGGV